jgi:trimeric autotransporter adhesin
MIEQMQAFWTGDARAAALLDAHPLLAAVPREALLETVRRGCGFHSIWDVRALGQLRDVLDRAAAATDGGAAATALSELHAALAAGGGLRAQARAVGMLLFRVAAREYGELQEEEQHSTGDTAAATAALTAPVGGGAVEQALAQEPEHRQDQQHQLEQPALPAASPPRGSSHQAPPSPPLAQNHTMSASSMSLGGISSISSPGSFSGSSELPTTAGAGAATCAADAAACAFPRRYRLSRWLPPGAVLRVRTAAGIGPGSTVIGLLGAGVECEAVAEKRLPPSDGHGGGAEHWVEVRLAGLRLAPPPPAETTSSSEVGAAAPTAWVMATMPPAAAAAAAAAAATHPPPVCNWGPGLCEDGAAATHYCGSCAEHLCAECLATHRRARATRSHTAAVAAKPAPGSAAAAARLAPLLEGVMPFGGSGGCGDSSNTSGDGFGAAVFSAAMMSSSSVSSVGTVSAAGASLVSSESHGGAGSGCFLDQSSLSLSMSEVSNIVDRSGPGAVEAVVSHALAPTATDAAHNGAAAAQDSEAEPAAAEEFDAAAVAAAAAASSAVAAAAAASVAMNAAAAEVERARECEAEMRRQATSAAISSAVIAAITAARCAANDAIDAADRAIGAAASAAAQAVSTAAVDEDQVDEERRRRRKKAQATEVLEDEQKAVDSAAKRRATEQAASAEATAAAAVQAFAAAAAATAAADDAVADANAVAAHEAAVAAETAAEAAAADAEESAIAADERESLTAATAATSSRRAALRAEIEQLDAGLGGEGWKVRLAALQRFVAAALALAAADAAATAVARAEAATRRALRGRRCGNGSDRRRVRAVVPATVSSAEAGASADLSLSLWRLASLLGDIMADKSQHAQVAREVARTVELLSAGHALGTDAAGCRCSDAVVAEGSAVRGGAPASAMEPDIDASAVLSAAQVSSLSLDLSEDAVNDRDEDDDSGDSGDGATAGHNKAQRRDRCAAAAKVRSDARREAAALASRLVAPLLARLGCRDATLARAIGAALDKLYRHALPLRRCLRLTTPLLEAPPAPKSTRLGSPDRGDSSRGPRAARSTPPKRAGVNGGTAASATLGSGASPADGPLSAPKQQAPPLARARVLGWLGRCMLSAYRHRLALLQVQQRQQQEAGTSPRGQEAHQHEQVERWLVFTPAPPELASLLLPSLTDREQKVRIRPPACFGWCWPLLTALLAQHSLTVSCSAGSCGGSAGTGICAAIAALARTF